ncbi:MAG TPA: ATP-binding protein, partial [Candidatus Binatia bacterium]|nr:ATP-binding protein [Candidatus Binatia bacterium]
MASGAPDILLDGPAVDRAEVHFREHHDRILRGTDRLFARLLAAEWLVGIAVAVVISPLAWAGIPGAAPSHLWTAVLLGGGIVALPIALALTRPGEPVTRHGVAVGQMLFAGLLVHLTGGRTETHFFVFGSLAVLAFYRDWRVLVTATGIVVLDHLLRGLLWPESVYGAESASPWRTAEHAWWLTFEDMFLIAACLQGNREMRGIAGHRARLESAEHVASVLEATPRQEVEAEMRKARDAAEAATRTKSEFLANMSHEIRTPMNGVLGMTGLLMGTELTADQREYVQMLRGSGEALLTLVNDILDFSKIEAGRLEVEEIDFDLHSVVQEAVNLLAERAHHKSLELAYLIHSEVPGAVCGDPGRLRQILLNLVGNAIKFTPSGEVILRARLATEDEDSRTIRFEVTDTGIGIDAEARARLFEPFTQAEGSTTRKFGGTGLGLAISRQLTELMGGRIGVESEAGKGSTFWFTVVLDRGDEDDQKIWNEEDTARLRVLVVDDNQISLEIEQDLLEAMSYQVTTAASGPEAIEALERSAAHGDANPFDLVLLDWKMPGMNGLELARHIREEMRLEPEPVLILITAFGNDEIRTEAEHVGVRALLTK